MPRPGPGSATGRRPRGIRGPRTTRNTRNTWPPLAVSVFRVVRGPEQVLSFSAFRVVRGPEQVLSFSVFRVVRGPEQVLSFSVFRVVRGLEQVLDPELHHAAVLRRSDPAEACRRADCGGRVVEADLVEDVERLHPDLDPPRAAELDILEQREIRRCEPRAANRVAAGIARTIGRGRHG